MGCSSSNQLIFVLLLALTLLANVFSYKFARIPRLAQSLRKISPIRSFDEKRVRDPSLEKIYIKADDTASANKLPQDERSNLDKIDEPGGFKIDSKLVNVIGSAFLAFGIFIFQNFQPASGVVLLQSMENESPSLQSVLCNGKPTVVDFYADWCENCKVS
jgi:hypothetical protein